jgi:phospholipid/cholesterol/gamma-HCH transport system substrate-binding protein
MKNTLETRLGLFVAFAAISAVLILEMVGAADFFRGGYTVSASFRTAQELKKGDLVRMAGVEIGRVKTVELEAGAAKVVMKINKGKTIKTDSKAAIRFTGLMGQNYVNIEFGTPAAPNAGEGFALPTDEQPDLSSLMVKLETVADSVKGLAEGFKPENIAPLFGPITDFVKQNSNSLTTVIGNFRTVSDRIANGEGTVGKLIKDDALYNSAFGVTTNFQAASADIRSMISRAQGIIDDVNAGKGTLGKLTKDEALYQDTTVAMTNLKEILEKINRGQGSVGKLVNDESFFKNVKLTLQKVDKATEGLEDQGPLSVLGLAIGTLF